MKKIARTIASVMLLLGLGFFLFALNHPEGAFPWSNTISYTIYMLYIAVMILLFITSFKGKDQ